ncbi:MAG TPA: T9SS type A sorting domain-containing protein [Puia sp.]|nr:T9SS type A sorting domain-containing protein [Puia sp.]
MKPVKPITHLTALRAVLLCMLITAASLNANAQCATGLQQQSYNIVLNGTGNNTWGFSFPQFDPSIGTLVAVDINSVVSVNMKFEIANIGSSADNYNVLASRNDDISISSLVMPISNSFSQNFGPYSLQATQDTIVDGPISSQHFFSLLNNYKINDSISSAVAGFLGTGYVSFNYYPSSGVSVTSGSNYDVIKTVSDTMTITMTYYYCTSNILASDITKFNVSKDGGFADIQWTTENEIVGRTYEIETSTNIKSFDSIGAVASFVKDGIGNYEYEYPIPSGPSGKMLFRIKEINNNGYVKYSEIRSIDIDKREKIYLYPNPANNFININFDGAFDWQASIFASDGRLVQNNSFNTSHARIDFAQRLPKGVYFIRTFNRQTNNMKTLSFSVR